MSGQKDRETPDILALCEESWRQYCSEEGLEDEELPDNDLAWSLMLTRSKRRSQADRMSEPGLPTSTLPDALTDVAAEAELVEARLRDLYAAVASLNLEVGVGETMQRHITHALGDIGFLIIAVRREVTRCKRDSDKGRSKP